MYKFLFIVFALFFTIPLYPQKRSLNTLPVRGLCIAAPTQLNLDSFVNFINQELRPRNINTLVLRIDYHYHFKSHPELTDTFALTKEDIKKIVYAAKNNSIRLIPQINLLGHQSWANKTGKLLSVYPQFDETPWLMMPAKYSWPNADSLYCKSYCPLHPDLHKIIFDVMDEICEAFESTAFHAGMDEVFIIGDNKCPRCAGKSKAELFAGEVNLIHDHLKKKKRELWIWGDRLLDGKTTGVGIWEGSFNDTYEGIDKISKDVVICDWHYERPDKTAGYFASKGFRVITCPWNRPDVARIQLSDMIGLRKETKGKIRSRYAGIMETVWSPVTTFFNGFYGRTTLPLSEQAADTVNTTWNTFRALFSQ